MVKNLAANEGDARNSGFIPGSGRSPGEVSGNPLQYSCLENPMDREAWRATECIRLQRVRHDLSDLAYTHAQYESRWGVKFLYVTERIRNVILVNSLEMMTTKMLKNTPQI